MEKNISKASLDIIRRMQQGELTESVIYEKIARFAKGEENKQVLLRLSREEKAHYEIWKKYTGEEMKPQKGKVLWYTLLARVLGFTFAVKLMENGEENAQDEYEALAGEVKESVAIRQQEEEHEQALLGMLDEERLQYVGSMVLGLIHLNTGMVINVVQKVKHGDVAGAIWEEGALWVTLVGIILFVLKIGNVAGVPVVLVIGCVMVLFGGTRNAKGFGKLTSIFGTVYNTLTGWFGDILSYSRIMALMLAGSVIAQVFNTIGAIANNLVVFFIIFLIGHALNFALNLLGCYVHDLRLQCLEYFGKFYKDGGRAFAPLRIKTKYYDTVEQ